MMNSVLRSERVYFADFSLIIFDECHHCDKGHPYKSMRINNFFSAFLGELSKHSENKINYCNVNLI
jgi:superfamily II DNA or RNA helicase